MPSEQSVAAAQVWKHAPPASSVEGPPSAVTVSCTQYPCPAQSELVEQGAEHTPEAPWALDATSRQKPLAHAEGCEHTPPKGSSAASTASPLPVLTWPLEPQAERARPRPSAEATTAHHAMVDATDPTADAWWA